MANEMSELIYINVLGFPDKNLEPVGAEHVHGSCFKIVSENDDDEHFPWEFITGEVVACEKVTFSENEYGLVARKKCCCNV